MYIMMGLTSIPVANVRQVERNEGHTTQLFGQRDQSGPCFPQLLLSTCLLVCASAPQSTPHLTMHMNRVTNSGVTTRRAVKGGVLPGHHLLSQLPRLEFHIAICDILYHTACRLHSSSTPQAPHSTTALRGQASS
jgi:hypothetical protein